MKTSIETIKKIMRYDPKSGKLIWNRRSVDMYAEIEPDIREEDRLGRVTFFNSRYANKEVYADPITGYVRVSTRAHKFERIRDVRLIWWMVTGSKPEYTVVKKDPNKPNTPDNILHVTDSVAPLIARPDTGIFPTVNGFGFRIEAGGRRLKRSGFGSKKAAHAARVDMLKSLGLFHMESLAGYMVRAGINAKIGDLQE